MRRSAVTVEWSVEFSLIVHSLSDLRNWHCRGLFRDPKFVLLFLGSGIATFPLLVPPFFIPLYASSVGASASLASCLLATYSIASAVGRVGFGVLGDSVGPITALVLALTVNALSMLTIWPASSSIAPLVAFIVINGFGSGGFFSLIPSVVGRVYGNTRTANALAMTISGWAFGYFLVRSFPYSRAVHKLTGNYSADAGFTCRRLAAASIRRFQCGSRSFPACDLLCRVVGLG